ncbi:MULTISPECIES: LPS export ABC transporter permease LptF [Halomonadaceae]|uniref:Lipopolysaccharide export system permease protein LptF n=1 Tax=Vreelandella janggokensis TaxID=370767 RepID=A0ABT4IR98_9GAMM|nr:MULTISPECIES: LPS export ABC transporter permease LptF [Halomonas]MCW4150110.1 LPS export ABC transporter permease LptF [Halomonas sp. 18H]MCZ0926196.1 LPS export ABC transporter permease LptF [Halomonas janggokensis]MCZ0931263.1 LPS export ABC transporter permease LptF [Halomonas janggokensis]MDR5887704.1 LPS export ABC transporter permease LptF [Halomonas janggokensis]QPL46751.1 LPS export ABC transporter permease LptF [Halomonas sp. A40-4]
MILFRYLTREVLVTMSAVAGILLLVIMGSRFIRYFSDAAEGDFPVNILGSLMVYHLPGFMELILPLSFFLGILLAYGQLYMNSEITVMVACGMSPKRLLKVTLLPASAVAIVVGVCSLWLTPAGALQTAAIIEEQESRLDVSVLAPGRFQEFGGGRTAYISGFNDDGSEMQDVLVHEQRQPGDDAEHNYVTRAVSGYQETRMDTGSRFLVLNDGERYGVTPGQRNAERLTFERYTLRLGLSRDRQELDSLEYATTLALWQDDNDRAQAQWQWRAGLPLMVFILAIMAQPLSRVNPRQGRFAKLLPAVFLYVAYLSLLLAAVDAVGSGAWSTSVGIWPVHGLFLALGLLLIWHSQRKGMR